MRCCINKTVSISSDPFCSLMGAGMEMRPSDFNKAFCSKINNLKIKGVRPDLTTGCKWEAN